MGLVHTQLRGGMNRLVSRDFAYTQSSGGGGLMGIFPKTNSFALKATMSSEDRL